MSDFFGTGKKEGLDRAKAVSQRRSLAMTMTTDLDSELAEVRVTLELDAPTYQPSDLESIKKPFSQAQRLMDEIYAEVNMIMGQTMPDRLTDTQAYEFVQPALRIESKAAELRNWLKQAREVKAKLDRPKTQIQNSLTLADRKRLSAEAELSQAHNLVDQMKEARAENYPQASAALLTAEREISAASTMVNAAQQAVLRNAYREALDLTQRAASMFDSGINKLGTVKIAGRDFERAADTADDMLQKALSHLQEAKTELTDRAAILSADPNTYFSAAVQRIGEARRAFKATPPQAMTCYRLATEAITLIDDALERAREEVRRLRDGRINARSLLQKLQEAVADTRLAINEKQAVPIKAKDLYTSARDERDRLLQLVIDKLSLDELDQFASIANLALKQAETAAGMLR